MVLLQFSQITPRHDELTSAGQPAFPNMEPGQPSVRGYGMVKTNYEYWCRWEAREMLAGFKMANRHRQRFSSESFFLFYSENTLRDKQFESFIRDSFLALQV